MTDQSVALAADAEAGITNSGTNVSHKTRTTEARSGTLGATVEVAAQAAQIQADSSAVTNATNSQVINDVPNVTQNPLFYAMLQNGVQLRNETSTSTLGDL